MTESWFSTAQAAFFLGVHVQAVKYHVYIVKDLQGEIHDKKLMFSRGALEAFQQRLPAPGRKAGKTTRPDTLKSAKRLFVQPPAKNDSK